MSSGERPIGVTKGKQPNTKALCQPPTPLAHCPRSRYGILLCFQMSCNSLIPRQFCMEKGSCIGMTW